MEVCSECKENYYGSYRVLLGISGCCTRNTISCYYICDTLILLWRQLHAGKSTTDGVFFCAVLDMVRIQSWISSFICGFVDTTNILTVLGAHCHYHAEFILIVNCSTCMYFMTNWWLWFDHLVLYYYFKVDHLNIHSEAHQRGTAHYRFSLNSLRHKKVRSLFELTICVIMEICVTSCKAEGYLAGLHTRAFDWMAR